MRCPYEYWCSIFPSTPSGTYETQKRRSSNSKNQKGEPTTLNHFSAEQWYLESPPVCRRGRNHPLNGSRCHCGETETLSDYCNHRDALLFFSFNARVHPLHIATDRRQGASLAASFPLSEKGYWMEERF
ncbi:hypothetical protein CDAR_398501 [Caerostris darwini]|uniref:Uncharacterized protein n=1 Tax=Caerostris darwini TaxID=1538125 RepID=A0AAV4VE05_9ARAC|nr:hypothetical protein CDAR_398501 [Caerostris darwini]